MRKPLNATTAAEIAALVPGIMRIRAEHADPRDWSELRYYRQYVALLNTGAAWRVNATTVAGCVTGPNSGTWDQVVADAFDVASQDYDLPRGHIHHTGPGRYVFDLACECDGACTQPAE